jgi:hypothetical protein
VSWNETKSQGHTGSLQRQVTQHHGGSFRPL